MSVIADDFDPETPSIGPPARELTPDEAAAAEAAVEAAWARVLAKNTAATDD